MGPEKIIQHIDDTIINQLEIGCRWDVILETLQDKVRRYKKRDGFIQVTEKYLVNNWQKIDWKKRMTTMIVIQSMRRIEGINWIKKNHHKFPQYGNLGMLNLLKLKDKVLYNSID